jgi:hypothetical protein
MTSPRSNLLYQQEEAQEDGYFNSKPSYYKRGNLLVTSSFRQKYKGFRARSSSYTSLDDKEQNSLKPTIPAASAFLLRNKKERSSSLFNGKNKDTSAVDEDEDGDESTFFAKNKRDYSRQNLTKPSSWKSSVLKAVGVKSR